MKHRIVYTIIASALALFLSGCDAEQKPQPKSASGVQRTSVQVQTGTDGLTTEQRNVRDRLTEDNKPGSIKHLYVVSAYSGDVLIYSTVKGKVTSSGKRLTPTSIVVGASGDFKRSGFPALDGYVTSEVLQDDGTYGSSTEYLYWWDVQGRYHQHYPAGGQIIHVSNEPLLVKRVILNVSATEATP